VRAGPAPVQAGHGATWTTLLSCDGDLSAILSELTVLAAFATALVTLASVALGHRLTTSAGT
jgi:ABC-2 type transport system permease protein